MVLKPTVLEVINKMHILSQYGYAKIYIYIYIYIHACVCVCVCKLQLETNYGTAVQCLEYQTEYKWEICIALYEIYFLQSNYYLSNSKILSAK